MSTANEFQVEIFIGISLTDCVISTIFHIYIQQQQNDLFVLFFCPSV